MNERMFKGINQYAGTSRLLDFLMVLISGKARYVYLLVVIILCVRRHAYRKMAAYTGVSVGVAYIICFLIKLFSFQPRPYVKHSVHLLPPFPSKKDSSFPSKHTTLAFAMAASVIVYHRLAGSLLWLLSVLVGVSRIWTGQHYPSDIVGSAIIGNVTAYLVKQLKPINRFLRIIN
ncbi:phosphatase PAP2 family protein [Neobacillus mesonae]|uniref:Phosphatase PAP2 family protein n=1 Tax=Neobacillus mesonae TaxID=1193713 RepID=A0A3T0HXT4_9BACI|nr:phosphatase PAP2 family protein [Neobacillus mesonae]AZU61916.1 phosphatase PAP2 family protein [Neobacillus mesonae]